MFLRAFAMSSWLLSMAAAGTSGVIDGTISRRNSEPYAAAGASERQVVSHPGARELELHFAHFELPPGDELRLLDGAERELARYHGRGRAQRGEFWSIAVPGDVVQLEHLTRGAPPALGNWGFAIDAYRARLPEAVSRSICGSDQRLPIGCADPALQATARAVGRLSIGTESCTAWLVSCRNWIVTNAHCIGSQDDAERATVTFGDDAPCGWPSSATAPEPVELTELLFKDGDRDIALIAIDTTRIDAAALFGYLPLGSSEDGADFVLPQHPAGGPKQIALADDTEASGLCRQQLVGEWVDHGCDTSAGASGAPLIANGRAVGLHAKGAASAYCSAADRNRALSGTALAAAIGEQVACPPSCAATEVVGFTLRSTCSGPELHWSPLGDDVEYEVRRSVAGCGGESELIARTAAPGFTDGTAVDHQAYAYLIRARTACGRSVESACLATTAAVRPPSPDGLSVASSCLGNQITATPTEGAGFYEFYRTDAGCRSDGAEKIVESFEPSFLDVRARTGEVVGYFVRAKNACGPSPNSPCQLAVRPAPLSRFAVGVEASGECGGIAVRWGAVTGASSYRVSRNDAGCETADLHLLATVTGQTFIDGSARAGVLYGYVVAAADPCGNVVSSSCLPASRPRAAAVTKMVAKRWCDWAQIDWEPATGASSYLVERTTASCSVPSAAWELIGQVSTTYFLDRDVPERSEPVYRIHAVHECGTAESQACARLQPGGCDGPPPLVEADERPLGNE